MLECGNCTACCEGWLEGNAYGNTFGKHKKCVFLCDKTCTVYNTRPITCSNYQCAWTQGLFPEWMKPTESNVIISVETNDKFQFLKVIELGNPIRTDVLEYIENWVKQHNTYFILIKGERNEN